MIKINAFSMVELVVVLAVVGIVGAVGIGSSTAYINSTDVNEYTSNLQLDILNTQRKAMLLQRDFGESWPYGISLRFESSSTYKYKDSKFCSTYKEFDSTKRKLVDKLPSFSGGSISFNNGRYPLNVFVGGSSEEEGVTEQKSSSYNNCTANSLTDYIVLTPQDPRPYYPGVSVSFSFNNSPVIVHNIFFESITGRTIFYNQYGYSLIHKADGTIDQSLVDKPLIVNISKGNASKQLKLFPLSGMTEVL